MRKIAKTVEEIKRDELVTATRNAKEKIEHRVRVINRGQKVMAMLPQESAEYKAFADEVAENKWVLVSLLRDYDKTREELEEHNKTHHYPSGIGFLSGYKLLEILAEDN